MFHTQHTLPHGRQHLNIVHLRIYITRHLFLHQRKHYPQNHIRILPFQKEEIPALIIKRHLFSTVDLMGIDDNVTLAGLTENLRQHDNRIRFGSDNVL